MRELALPAPGDDRQLAEQAARIHARPLDRAHPLWELYVIQGLRDGRVAMFTKIHHAAIDGVSGAEILGVLLDPSPEGREVLPARRQPRPDALPSSMAMLGRGIAGLPRAQMRAARAVPQTLAHLDAIPGVQDIPGCRQARADDAPPRTRRPRRLATAGSSRPRATRRRARRSMGAITAHRRVAFDTLSLTDVKAIKNAHGVTVNDVVVTICAGALRAWLEDRGRAARRAARRDDPGVRAHQGAGRDVRQPRLDDRGRRSRRTSRTRWSGCTFAHEALRSAQGAPQGRARPRCCRTPRSSSRRRSSAVPSRVTLRISARRRCSRRCSTS